MQMKMAMIMKSNRSERSSIFLSNSLPLRSLQAKFIPPFDLYDLLLDPKSAGYSFSQSAQFSKAHHIEQLPSGLPFVFSTHGYFFHKCEKNIDSTLQVEPRVKARGELALDDIDFPFNIEISLRLGSIADYLFSFTFLMIRG